MTMYNSSVDPYHAEESRYECRDCGARVETGGECDGCGSDALMNIAVPRE
jgi:primosomal protein N'